MNVEIPALTALLSRGAFRDCSVSLYLNDEMFWTAYVSRVGVDVPVSVGEVDLSENGRSPADALAALETLVSGLK